LGCSAIALTGAACAQYRTGAVTEKKVAAISESSQRSDIS
jgi:hypothetical protein